MTSSDKKYEIDPTAGSFEDILLNQVLREIPYFVFWKDRKSVFIGCSQPFAKLAGLNSAKDIVGLTDYDIWEPKNAELYRADDQEVMEAAQPKLHIIEPLQTPTGEQAWLDTSKVPLMDADGNVIGIVGIFVDITEQKLAQQDLQRTRQHLEDAIEAIDAGLVMYDSSEKMVFCNESYRQIYVEATDVLIPGSNYEDILNVYAARSDVPMVDGVSPDEWVRHRLEQHRRCEQRWEQTLASRVIRISDSRTRDGGIVSLRTDVTEEKARETELWLAKDAAIAASEAKTSFLANMSHEIRTPMTAILGFTELLLNNSPRDDQSESLQTIQRNGEHLLRLINDILDLSKIEAGKFAIEREPVDVIDLVGEVIALMALRAESKSIQLDAVVDGRIPRTLDTDSTRLRQILVNLIGNAIKFTESGGVTLRVSTDFDSPKGTMLHIAVEDTGIGIKEGQIEQVFGAFEQADVSTTREYGGTGLGLSISRRLTMLLGGDIVATSDWGVGSCFTVQLPVGPITGWVDDAKVATARPAPASPSVDASHTDLTGKQILLAEDGRDNQLLISHILRVAGANVVIACDGKEAILRYETAQAEGRSFDAIFMDMQMPVLDGYAATQKLRKKGVTTPIIALTAHAMTGDRERCIDAGCNDYLCKPAKRNDLIAMAAKWSHPTPV